MPCEMEVQGKSWLHGNQSWKACRGAWVLQAERNGIQQDSSWIPQLHFCLCHQIHSPQFSTCPCFLVLWTALFQHYCSRNAVGPMGKARAWHPAGAQDTVIAELFSIPAQSHQGSSSQELQQLHWAAPLLPGLHSASPSRALRSFALNAEMLLGTRLCTLGLQGALSRMQLSSKRIQLPKLQAEP